MKAWGEIEEKKLTPEIIRELKAIQLRGCEL
jgi:DNA-directed RNA polymerase subunit K/omega